MAKLIVYISEMGTSNDHHNQVWYNLAHWLKKRRFKCENLQRMDDKHNMVVKSHTTFGQVG
jgi:uncharacterized protein YjiS (DUF1127 family)